MVLLAWCGWHGETIRNREPYVLSASLKRTRCPLGDLIHWIVLLGRRINSGDSRIGREARGGAAAFTLR